MKVYNYNSTRDFGRLVFAIIFYALALGLFTSPVLVPLLACTGHLHIRGSVPCGACPSDASR